MTRGETMRAAREKAGLTVRQLAKKAGVTAQCVYRLEHDESPGTVNVVEALADSLGLSIDAYIGHEVRPRG